MTTLMHACSWSGKGEIVSALLSHGADPAAADERGRSAADRARGANRPDLERLLQPVELLPATP